jgi:phosphoenolpyruvate synthase/pyruvate phosphate dikinase
VYLISGNKGRGNNMGYESKIFIVEKSTIKENGKRYAELIAMVNACKFYDLSKVFTVETDCYIYYNGEKILEDKYGEPLTEAHIKDIVEFLEKSEQKNPYRRATILLALLKSFRIEDWDNLAVLHYGY